MYSDTRDSGIPALGELRWGSDICQFYRTAQDLLDIWVPYLRSGLEHNELCVWVVADPLEPASARAALQAAVPGFESHARRGALEILPAAQWPDQADASSAIRAALNRAIASGYDGLRLAITAPGRAFSGRPPGEAAAGAEAIRRLNVLVGWAYPHDAHDAVGLMEVVGRHGLALIRHAGTWELLTSAEARFIQDAVQRSEAKLQSLFHHMSEGFAYHRMVLDAGGRPCDYIFLEVNEAFSRLTGLPRERLLGKSAKTALPGIEQDPADWIGRYGEVALTGRPAQFESYAVPLQRWYAVSAFSPHHGFFATVFTDITERTRREAQSRRQTAVVAGIARIFQEAMTCATEEALGRVCLSVAEELTESRLGFVGEINPQTGTLDDIAISDPGWEACRMRDRAGHGKRAPTGFAIQGLSRVLASGQAFFTNDPSSHPASSSTPAGHPPLRAFLGVPLMHGGSVMGILGLANRDGGYGPEDLEALEALAPAIVQAFQHKRAELGLQAALAEKDAALATNQTLGFQEEHVADHLQVVLGAVIDLAEQAVALGHRLPQVRQRLPERGLGVLARGDVAGDLGGSDDPAARVADRGDRHRDVDPPPVLADPHGLVVVDALASPQPGEDVRLLVRTVGRDEHGDGPPDRLGGRVAEEPFRPPVPGPDDPVELLADDGVVGRIDDRRQPKCGQVRRLGIMADQDGTPSASALPTGTTPRVSALHPLRALDRLLRRFTEEHHLFNVPRQPYRNGLRRRWRVRQHVHARGAAAARRAERVSGPVPLRMER
jgi:GAF domain-containing protein/PAS domain-containing protein